MAAAPARLTAEDGNKFRAYTARTSVASAAGVVIMPDVRGLHPFYSDLAVRFAEQGMHAVAIDYFGRTAGIGDRSASFDHIPHVKQTTAHGVAADVAAAASHLRGETSTADVFTVGFCFGGSYSWRMSADCPGLNGAIGFYGGPRQATPVISLMRAPILMLVGGNDELVTVAELAELAERVNRAGVGANLVTYDNVPHSFFDRAFAEHHDICMDAWQRVIDFIGRHRRDA